MLVINGRLNSFLPKTNHIGTHVIPILIFQIILHYGYIAIINVLVLNI